MICTACGAENRTGSKFCDQCAAPLASTCPACGEPNRADARFCASCAKPLTEAPASAASQPATGPSAERRFVSVLFADLVGFTSFADGRDPEQVRALQSRYFEAASEAITRHGGTVEKFIGDAVMAVWGTPIAHEDDAQRAVRAGLEVIDAVRALGHDLDARAGVVTGEAAVSIGATNQGMVAGDMVNTASRLQSSARAGRGAGGPEHRPGRIGDDRLRAGRRAAAQGQGGGDARLARGPRARRALERRPRRAAIRRPRRRAPTHEGAAARGRPRAAHPPRLDHRTRRNREEPAHRGARRLRRRDRGGRVVAHRPLAVLWRGDRLLGPRRDDPPARRPGGGR